VDDDNEAEMSSATAYNNPGIVGRTRRHQNVKIIPVKVLVAGPRFYAWPLRVSVELVDHGISDQYEFNGIHE